MKRVQSQTIFNDSVLATRRHRRKPRLGIKPRAGVGKKVRPPLHLPETFSRGYGIREPLQKRGAVDF